MSWDFPRIQKLSAPTLRQPIVNGLAVAFDAMPFFEPVGDLGSRLPTTGLQPISQLGLNLRPGNRADSSGRRVPFQQSLQPPA